MTLVVQDVLSALAVYDKALVQRTGGGSYKAIPIEMALGLQATSKRQSRRLTIARQRHFGLEVAATGLEPVTQGL